ENHVHALYNYGNAIAVMGRIEEGIEYLKRALPLFMDAVNIHTCRLSIAFCYLALGDLENGWEWYESRAKDDTFESVHYAIPRPRWRRDMPVEGKHIFVSAEQGLGDEIMFGTVLPDLIREVGPSGSVAIGVEPRLVPLFQKAFPDCRIVRHHTTDYKKQTIRVYPDVTDWSQYDCYILMADLLSRYRPDIDSFPQRNVFFRPDPERVAYWKAVLGGLNKKPKVGVLWKSLISHSRRNRYYSPFENWREILAIPGIQFINLQYGDTTAEMAEARAMGLDIWTPPGIDLKNDLDDLSALCVALDCVLGPANATSNIAGAAGATVWMVTQNHSWNCLGTDYFPWYPTTRVFFSPSMTDWQPVMDELRDALIDKYISGKK
ncbi:MAG: tetratricopeptide repeat protein, partial [Asticcacaulis sp.]|nr:tetratricopeptide repeat protein [Asticcacaulis sp.]